MGNIKDRGSSQMEEFGYISCKMYDLLLAAFTEQAFMDVLKMFDNVKQTS